MANTATAPRYFARVRTVAGNVTRRFVDAPDTAAALAKVRRGLKAGQVLVELRAGQLDERHGWQVAGDNLI